MNDQAASLRRKLQHAKDKKAKTIAIVSGKGGVGKSNTALNMAIEIQERGKKVLVIDMDIGMGNIDILLGIYSKYTIVDMFNDFLPVHDIIEKGPKGLSYIAGGSGITQFFSLNDEKTNWFYNQYEQLVRMYDFIFFDLGAGASRENLYFTLASDECIVITTPEPTALTDAYGMIKHVINNRRNMPIRVLMNRCYKPIECTNKINQFKHIIKKFLEVDVQLLGMLPEDKSVGSAVIQQIPYILLYKKAPISKAIGKVVDQYLVHSDSDFTNKNVPSSFIQRIKQLMTKR
ncbi:MinD/ParA family protein [Virgibacillus sp. W0430]|uniref:MinD/ParA family protein n=1 Tax=Virgibacillus sp. W0430 TaxID=3391580 RepID=UPI003F47EE80